MKGAKLEAAEKWFNMAVRKEAEGNIDYMNKCLNNAIKAEAEGIAAGESWD